VVEWSVSALHDGQTITRSPGLSRLRLHHARAQWPLAGAWRPHRSGYASRDRSKAEEYRRLYGGTASYPDYESAIADPAIDAVVVAVPPRFHLPLVLKALEAGKHVLVEKPAFLTLDDYETGPCRAGALGPHRPRRRERPL
jgi:hypothetical protein